MSQKFGGALPRNSAKIAIVGGGISGLTACQSLLKRGFKNVTVYEASGRLGGRICTEELGDGWVELGAQWIHGEQDNAAHDHALQHHLISTDVPSKVLDLQDIEFMTEDGRQLDRTIVSETLESTDTIVYGVRERATSADPAGGVSVNDYLDERFRQSVLSGCRNSEEVATRRLVQQWSKRMQCSIEGCDSLTEMSPASFSIYRECEGNLLVNFLAGYTSLVNSVASSIPHGHVQLNAPVQQIRLSEAESTAFGDGTGPVTIVFEDGRRRKADHAIVTVSLGVLKQKSASMFHPQLSAEKLKAIQDIGFGTVDKIFLEFVRPFWLQSSSGYALLWEESANTGSFVPWQRGLLGFFTVPFASNVLCGWMVGSCARVMEAAGDREVESTCLEVLRRFTGKAELPPLLSMTRSSWHRNPRVLGSYSYLTSRLEHPNQANNVLAKPVDIKLDKVQHPAILFAGEATHPHFYSTVHGAMETGIREANRIVEYYRDKSPTSKL